MRLRRDPCNDTPTNILGFLEERVAVYAHTRACVTQTPA